MSEYWKSKPKVWCDRCETFYRDTPFDKRQHEQTGKHQAATRRILRDLYRQRDQEEREAGTYVRPPARHRAGSTGHSSGSARTNPNWSRQAADSAGAGAASNIDPARRAQAEQLAALGVALPDELRAELALTTEWQVVGVHPTGSDRPPPPPPPPALAPPGAPPPGFVRVTNGQKEEDDRRKDEEEEEEPTDEATAPSYSSLAQILQSAKASAPPPPDDKEPEAAGSGGGQSESESEPDSADEEFEHFRAVTQAARVAEQERAAATEARLSESGLPAPLLANRRKVWGTSVKTYPQHRHADPGSRNQGSIDDELDALLGNTTGPPAQLDSKTDKQQDATKLVKQGQPTAPKRGFVAIDPDEEPTATSQDLVETSTKEDPVESIADDSVLKPTLPGGIKFKKRARPKP